MRLTVICKDPPEWLPPVLYLVQSLRRLGVEVRLAVSSLTWATHDWLEDLGVVVSTLARVRNPSCTLPYRLWRYLDFHLAARRFLDRLPRLEPLWVVGANTAIAMGPLLGRFPYVFHLLELYDTRPLYRKALCWAVRRASIVVVPEETRADLVRMWYRLEDRPVVLPNKPPTGQYHRRMPIVDPVARRAITAIGEKKQIILYQGILHPERDLLTVARAFRDTDSSFAFVVMGRDVGLLSVLRQAYPDLTYISHISPPAHLCVVSHAHVGIITYKPDTLNRLFCAPNKLWEYAAFGIPMLCDDLPALRPLFAAHEAGLLVNFRNPAQVRAAVGEICRTYERYSRAARELFLSVDEAKIISSVLDYLGRG